MEDKILHLSVGFLIVLLGLVFKKLFIAVYYIKIKKPNYIFNIYAYNCVYYIVDKKPIYEYTNNWCTDKCATSRS